LSNSNLKRSMANWSKCGVNVFIELGYNGLWV
jgi:hypothetical protein